MLSPRRAKSLRAQMACAQDGSACLAERLIVVHEALKRVGVLSAERLQLGVHELVGAPEGHGRGPGHACAEKTQ
eukprot:359052-Pyramimonas_sp.AAC.1